MAEIGKINNLKVNRIVEFGAYLDGEELGEILIPQKYLKSGIQINDILEVFVYNDSEDRLIATTESSFAQVGEFAWLQVKSINPVGAFLNWGLLKDLLVPFREQNTKLKEGNYCLVYIYLDHATKRIVASSKLDKFLDNIPSDYSMNEEVNIIVANETDIGYKVIINSCHWGILYKNQVFKSLSPGQKLKAFISKIREDQKIDLTLQKPGLEEVKELNEAILNELRKNNGFLPLTDKTNPNEIYRLFGASKKNYKKALGNLYKSRKISIEGNGIKLNT